MKKLSAISLLLVSFASLVACSNGNESNLQTEEKIKTAISSLRNITHTVNLDQSVTLRYDHSKDNKGEQTVDFTNVFHLTHTHIYGEDNLRAYKTKSYTELYDLDKDTGKMNESTYRINRHDEALYFKLPNGYAQREYIDVTNTVKTAISAYYDENTGRYTPIMFDTEFKNPFDYISFRDVYLRDDGTLTIINEKIEFLMECYGSIGLNKIKDNTLILNDAGAITSISFDIPDEVGSNYVRHNTVNLTFTNIGETQNHLTSLTNDNPDLKAAFDDFKTYTNYTYTKTYLGDKQLSDDTKDNFIKGYFTEDVIYFHHNEKPTDDKPYEGGDDIDYKAVKKNDGKYYVYEYVMTTTTYNWGAVMASSTVQLSYDNFEAVGPQFGMISPNIFKKTGDKTYEIDDYFLSIIGKYMDYQMMGVASEAFNGGTTKCVITLTEDNKIDEILTSFTFMGDTFNLSYKLSDVGTTVVPSWAHQG